MSAGLISGLTCIDMLGNLFDEHLLPAKETIEKQLPKMPIAYHIGSITPMTEGRSGIITTDEEKVDNWKATVLNNVLFSVVLNRIYRILEWFIDEYEVEGLENCLNRIYSTSIIYDESRSALIEAIWHKYLTEDIVGFVYSAIPQIEHSLKLVLENLGISVRERNIKHLEEITLNTILSNHNDQFIKIFGERFCEVLWLCFQYDFGLNIRNSVLHGGGLMYLSKEYALLLFFIFGFINYKAYELHLSEAENKEGSEE